MNSPSAKSPRFHFSISLLFGLLASAALGVAIALLSGEPRLRDGRPDYRDLLLRDADGREVRLGDYQGRPVMLHFFTTWCTQCEAMAPVLATTHKDLGEDLQIVGVSLDLLPDFQLHDAKLDPVARSVVVNDFLKRHDAGYPVLFDRNGDCAVALNGYEVPVHVVFDSDTKLLRRFTGQRTQDGFQAILQACLEEDRERRNL